MTVTPSSLLQCKCVDSQSNGRFTALSTMPRIPSMASVTTLLLRMRRPSEEGSGRKVVYERRAAYLKSAYMRLVYI